MTHWLPRAALALGAMAGLTVVVPGGRANAQATGVQSGYWSEVPAGPQVPNGGTEVSSNAAGPTAVAAFRFQLRAGESPGVLTLQVSSAEPASQVAVIACPVSATSAGWQPPSGAGSYSSAPSADCSHGHVAGDLSANGAAMTFDLSTLFHSRSTIDVVVEPDKVASPVPAGTAPFPTGSYYPTFDVAFDPVTTDSISTTGSSSASSPAQQPASQPQQAPSAPSSGATTAPAAAASGLSSVLPSSSGLGSDPAPVAPSVATPGSIPETAPIGGKASPQSSAQPVSQQVPAATPSSAGRRSSGPSPWRWRAELAVSLALIDLLAIMWYQQTHQPGGTQKRLSIYDPPPLPSDQPDAVTP